jgi:hypothetical protein
MKWKSVANSLLSHPRTVNTSHLFISVFRNSTVYRTWAKLSCLSHKYCTPYLTSKSFHVLRGDWNGFNVPYTNAGKGYSSKVELHFGYLRDKTKDALDFILFLPVRSCWWALTRIYTSCLLLTSKHNPTHKPNRNNTCQHGAWIFYASTKLYRFLRFVSPCIIVQLK